MARATTCSSAPGSVCATSSRGRREGPVFLRFPFGSWCAVYLSAIGILARLIQRDRGGAAGGPAHTSLAQGALVPTMMHWARAETPGPMFAWGLPKDLIPSMFEAGDGTWIHLMRNADVDSPLMVQAFAELGEEGVAAANAAFSGMATPGISQLRGEPGGLLDQAGPGVARGLLGERHPCTAFGAVRRHPGRRAGPGERLRHRGGRPGPGEGHSGRHAVLHRTPFPGDRSGAVTGPAHPRGVGRRRRERGSAANSAGDGDGAAVPAAAAVRAPLEGLRVLDLGNFLAGPLGPMLLADLGADVIKVEATTGDKMRNVQRVFAACQRGKRGVALDLKSPAARPALEALVAWADVVHHNLRMPAARKLGLDYESLRAINPDVIYCHASSYGPKGERADWPGYDQLFQASAGWEVLGGGEGNHPMWFRFGFMDHLCAMGSTVATLLAVYHRDRTGTAQFVTGSLLGGGVLTNSETFLQDGGLAASADPLDHEQMGLSAGYRLYALADGWIALCATEDGQLERACAVGRGRRPDRAGRRRLAGASCDTTLAALHEAGVPCEPVKLDQGEAFLERPVEPGARPGGQLPPRRMGRAGAGRGALGPRRSRSDPGAWRHPRWASTPSRSCASSASTRT